MEMDYSIHAVKHINHLPLPIFFFHINSFK
uniref:Uncharacterized protein n=1 Tax=Arundo donax TaxID=35708 RepID=A0A0A8Y806_ARUDO